MDTEVIGNTLSTWDRYILESLQVVGMLVVDCKVNGTLNMEDIAVATYELADALYSKNPTNPKNKEI